MRKYLVYAVNNWKGKTHKNIVGSVVENLNPIRGEFEKHLYLNMFPNTQFIIEGRGDDVVENIDIMEELTKE